MQPLMEKVRNPPDASLHAFLRAERHFPFQWHYHPEYELTLIVSGRGQRFVADHVANYRDGDLVLLGPLLPHTWRSTSGRAGQQQRAVVVQFPENFLGSALADCTELQGANDLLARARQGLQFLGKRRTSVARRLEAFLKMRGADRLAEFIRILDLLATSPDYRPLASEAYVVPRRQFAPTRLIGVLETIHQNYRQRLRQTELAHVTGMSPAAFSRNFRNATGTTLVDYVNDLRIGHACRLLAETATPVTEICFESGFANLSNFNRCFRRRRGMTPSQFRGQFRG